MLDELRVTGSVAVESGGSYAINAQLRSAEGIQIGEFQSTVPLAAGPNAFVLAFDGEQIGQSGIDGPYAVEDLSVYSPSDPNAVGYLLAAHTTAPYTAEQFRATPVAASVTHSFSFASGLDGWTGSGTHCTSQHSSSDGTPAGSLSTTVSGKNRTASCTWRSQAGTWQDFGVPAGATVTSVRLESAASRVAACNECLAGSIDGYSIRTGLGTEVASLWSGRSLAPGTEAWQPITSQPDQAVPAAWQAADSEVRLTLASTLKTGNKNSSNVTLRQDEIVLVCAYYELPVNPQQTNCFVGP